MEAVAKPAGVAVVPIVGGMAVQKQSRLLSYRPPVVVATPGRLWELMRDGQEHLTDMTGLSFLVLDEADRMLQQGHFQVRPCYHSRICLITLRASHNVQTTCNTTAGSRMLMRCMCHVQSRS